MSVIYTGLFLSEPVRNLLLNRFPAQHNNVYADHVTLFYKPDKEAIQVMEQKTGMLVSVLVYLHTHDSKGQALIVAPDVVSAGALTGVKITTEIMHITISCADETQPVYSNTLLKDSVKVASMGSPIYEFSAFLGMCSHEDKDVLPASMHKRRGLSR